VQVNAEIAPGCKLSAYLMIPYLPKDRVLFIEPITAIESDKKLAVVCVCSASIGTSNQTSVIEPQSRMYLINKWSSIYGIPTCSSHSN
jgi:hypothetical protein